MAFFVPVITEGKEMGAIVRPNFFGAFVPKFRPGAVIYFSSVGESMNACVDSHRYPNVDPKTFESLQTFFQGTMKVEVWRDGVVLSCPHEKGSERFTPAVFQRQLAMLGIQAAVTPFTEKIAG